MVIGGRRGQASGPTRRRPGPAASVRPAAFPGPWRRLAGRHGQKRPMVTSFPPRVLAPRRAPGADHRRDVGAGGSKNYSVGLRRYGVGDSPCAIKIPQIEPGPWHRAPRPSAPGHRTTDVARGVVFRREQSAAARVTLGCKRAKAPESLKRDCSGSSRRVSSSARAVLEQLEQVDGLQARRLARWSW